MKLGIVGSRTFTNYKLLCESIAKLPQQCDVTTIVSGGAQGADALAKKFAKEHDIQLIEHLPDWKRFGRAAGPKRNLQIVKDSDHILIFWNGQSKGTKNTITLAKKNNKPVTIQHTRETIQK